MAKTTKLVQGIHSLIKFQKHQGVQSLTIEGREDLADLSQDKNGDTVLTMIADQYKINELDSNVPYLIPTHESSTMGGETSKKAVINQDLTLFPLNDGELVTVTKERESLTINDNKVKEFVNTTITNKETAIKQFIGEVKEELTTKINEHSGEKSNQPTKTATFLSGFSIDSNKFIKDFSLKLGNDTEIYGVCVLYVSYNSAGTNQSFIVPFYASDTGLKNINEVQIQVKGIGSVTIDVTLPTVPTESLNFMLVSYSSTKEGEGTLTVTGIE